jgi:hypothetical protein
MYKQVEHLELTLSKRDKLGTQCVALQQELVSLKAGHKSERKEMQLLSKTVVRLQVLSLLALLAGVAARP